MRYPDDSRSEHHHRGRHHGRDAPRAERRRSPDTSRRYRDDTGYRDRDRQWQGRPDRERDSGEPRGTDEHIGRDYYHHQDAKANSRRNGRHEPAFDRLPSRPNKRHVDNDPSINASSFSEYRQLKRQKMAERREYLIWERSPPPIDEPLLQEEDEIVARAAAGDQPTSVLVKSAQEEALDQEELQLFCEWLQERKQKQKEDAEKRRVEEEERRPVGPMLPTTATESGAEGDYGVNLRPGEGERMAAYAKQGQRIPRRGEVGLDSEQIKSFEDIGYVMSGNRHSRMNAIRIRKENQIYTAEEKAALAMFNAEEAQRKEAKLVDEMKKLVAETVGQQTEEAGQDK